MAKGESAATTGAAAVGGMALGPIIANACAVIAGGADGSFAESRGGADGDGVAAGRAAGAAETWEGDSTIAGSSDGFIDATDTAERDRTITSALAAAAASSPPVRDGDGRLRGGRMERTLPVERFVCVIASKLKS